LIVTGNAIGQVGEPEASAHEDMNWVTVSTNFSTSALALLS
jgi:hypothetical protein